MVRTTGCFCDCRIVRLLVFISVGFISLLLFILGGSLPATLQPAYACGLAGGPTMTVNNNLAMPNPAAASASPAADQPPIGLFPKPVITDQNLTFAEDLSQTNLKPSEYLWDFGDGTQVTTSSTTEQHTYAHPGLSYTVTVSIKQNNSSSANFSPLDSASLQVLAVPWTNPPVAVASVDHTPAKGGTALAFDASASISKVGGDLQYNWNFGDGQSASGEKVTHTFVLSGSTVVTLTVTDNKGAEAIDQIPVTISGNSVAEASFNSQGSMVIGQQITFNGSASKAINEGGRISKYSWDFGDGSNQSSSNPTIVHSYKSAGVYRVVLQATDNSGNTAESMQALTVAATSSSHIAPTVTTSKSSSISTSPTAAPTATPGGTATSSSGANTSLPIIVIGIGILIIGMVIWLATSPKQSAKLGSKNTRNKR